MDAKQVIASDLRMAEFTCNSYLDDLTDEQLMMRPHTGCNHLKWQLGHLISSEHQMIEGLVPGSMPPLPDGFAARYTKETTASDDPAQFDSKEVLMQTYKDQREATKAALEKIDPAQLDADGPEPMREIAPTVGDVFALQASHWMMHAGQWVIVRRNLGHPAAF